MSRGKAIFGKAVRLLALAGCGAAIGLLAIEFVLLRGILRYSGVSDVASIFQHDPRWGWRFSPGASGEHSDLDFRVHYQINSRGLRQPEIGYEKAAGTFRILALGDSFTEGYGVEAEQAYPRRVESLLRAKGERVEVINAGLRGTSSDQHLLFLLDEGLKYKPDLVLLGFVRGDENNTAVAGYMGSRVYFKPYFAASDESLQLQGVPVPQMDASSLANDKWEPLKRWLRPLALYRWVQVKLTAGTLRQAFVNAGLVKKSAHSVAARSNGPGLTFGPDAWQVTASILRQMKGASEAHGGQFIVFLAAGDEAYGRQLLALAQSNGTEFLDVANNATFREGVARGDFRLPNDGHWNAQGHEAAAQILSQFLLTRQFARAGAH